MRVPRRARVAVSALAVGLAACLAGCSVPAAGAASVSAPAAPTAAAHSIPSVRPFVSEAPSPAGGSTPISAAQAPLQQLWAALDSGLRSDAPWPARQAGQLPQDFSDFAAAVTARCEPGLHAGAAQQLEQLRGQVVAQAATAGADLYSAEVAYFHAATVACM